MSGIFDHEAEPPAPPRRDPPDLAPRHAVPREAPPDVTPPRESRPREVLPSELADLGEGDGFARTELPDEPPAAAVARGERAAREDEGDARPDEVSAAPPGAEPLAPPAPSSASESEHAQGELRVPAGIRVFGGTPNGSRRSVGIAVGKFNGAITSRLLDGALAELQAAGVAPEAIELMPVPGAFELPLAAMALAKSRRYSCVIALGCVIRGETPHFEYVSAEAASGVQLAGLETGVPVAFGVLTCDTLEQAEERAGGRRGNKGAEAARSALEMVESLAQLRATLAT